MNYYGLPECGEHFHDKCAEWQRTPLREAQLMIEKAAKHEHLARLEEIKKLPFPDSLWLAIDERKAQEKRDQELFSKHEKQRREWLDNEIKNRNEWAPIKKYESIADLSDAEHKFLTMCTMASSVPFNFFTKPRRKSYLHLPRVLHDPVADAARVADGGVLQGAFPIIAQAFAELCRERPELQEYYDRAEAADKAAR